MFNVRKTNFALNRNQRVKYCTKKNKEKPNNNDRVYCFAIKRNNLVKLYENLKFKRTATINDNDPYLKVFSFFFFFFV